MPSGSDDTAAASTLLLLADAKLAVCFLYYLCILSPAVIATGKPAAVTSCFRDI